MACPSNSESAASGTESRSPSSEPAAGFSADLYGPVPAGGVARGELRVPGSKSIAQRYLALALLARRELLLRGAPDADDVRHFVGALRAAGWTVEAQEHAGMSAAALRLVPPAGEPSPDRIVPVDCGAGGTMYRFLTAVLCAVPGRWRIDGTERLRQRPVGPLVAALRRLGVEIRFSREEGYAPVEVHGGNLQSGRTVLDAGASSQYLSALLLAATSAPGPVTVEVAALTSEPYVDLTLDAIEVFGGSVRRDRGDEDMPDAHGRVEFRVEPGLEPPAEVTVEADLSAVAYPAAAAALTGGDVTILDVDAASRQGDLAFLDLLSRMGAEVTWSGEGEERSVRVRGTGVLRALDEDLSSTPDQVPTLAALAPFAEGTTIIRNVPHLRLKESDRLRAMATELRRVGAQVEELEDGLVIEGTWSDPAAGPEARIPTEPVVCDTWDDHRIAMSMALLGLRRPGISLREPHVVAKSYPAFFRDLERLLEPPG